MVRDARESRVLSWWCVGRLACWSEKTGFLVLHIFKLWKLTSERSFDTPVVSPTLTVGAAHFGKSG